MDEREHTVEQWKELIYQEVMDYEVHLNNNNNNADGSGGGGGGTEGNAR